MALKFGTSGVRGLVEEMTDYECFLYTRAFADHLKQHYHPQTVCLAGDYRSSTPRIMEAVAFAINDAGLDLNYCAMVPTPTLAVEVLRLQAGGIMVTGSHIPDDRNGIKFYTPDCEVLKSDELEISKRYQALKQGPVHLAFAEDGSLLQAQVPELGGAEPHIQQQYVQRYLKFFPADCLAGMNLVVYQHSTVGRDLIPEILGGLGATVRLLGLSDTFVPVDTEAVANPEELSEWVTSHGADALVSADGDCDRPLLVAEDGQVIRGDVLGILASDYLQADAVVTPVSCNSALELSGKFKNTIRTQIGSPFVVAGMNDAVAAGGKVVVGYEANGGFLTGTDITAHHSKSVLSALPTRDAVLPILAVLVHALEKGMALSSLLKELPPRFTESGLIRPLPNAIGKAIVERFRTGGLEQVETFFSEAFGKCVTLDMTDGARMTFADGNIVHLRPSGNAPEFRCYTESNTESQARSHNQRAQAIVTGNLLPAFS